MRSTVLATSAGLTLLWKGSNLAVSETVMPSVMRSDAGKIRFPKPSNSSALITAVNGVSSSTRSEPSFGRGACGSSVPSAAADAAGEISRSAGVPVSSAPLRSSTAEPAPNVMSFRFLRSSSSVVTPATVGQRGLPILSGSLSIEPRRRTVRNVLLMGEPAVPSSARKWAIASWAGCLPPLFQQSTGVGEAAGNGRSSSPRGAAEHRQPRGDTSP